MSLRVVGYVGRKPVYHDEGPAYARLANPGGSLVVGYDADERPRLRYGVRDCLKCGEPLQARAKLAICMLCRQELAMLAKQHG